MAATVELIDLQGHGLRVLGGAPVYKRDVTMAKALLAEAGATNLTL